MKDREADVRDKHTDRQTDRQTDPSHRVMFKTGPVQSKMIVSGVRLPQGKGAPRSPQGPGRFMALSRTHWGSRGYRLLGYGGGGGRMEAVWMKFGSLTDRIGT